MRSSQHFDPGVKNTISVWLKLTGAKSWSYARWLWANPTGLPVLSAGLVMLDGFVYAVGGWEGRSRLDSVECYNPHTNLWQFTESYKMAVTSPAVVALDGLLYVTGRKSCGPALEIHLHTLLILILSFTSW